MSEKVESGLDALRKRFDQIEREVAEGKHTAASVFTQMRTAAIYIGQSDAERALQLKHEAHRKTWRQLEQVKGLLQEIIDALRNDRDLGLWQCRMNEADRWEQRIAALSQQAEPLTPTPIGESTARLMHAYAIGEFDNEGGSETVEALSVQSWDALREDIAEDLDFNSYMAGYVTALYEQAHPLLALVSQQAEPAPAQDERDLFGTEKAALRFCEQRGIEDDSPYRDRALDAFTSGAAWQRSELTTHPAQTEQQPEQLPYWEPCNPGCDPEFNGKRSRHCAELCHGARAALSATPNSKEKDHD